MSTLHNIGAIILAAGKGKRMKATTVNKVAYVLGGKPMIVHAVDLLKDVGLSPIVIVVGFAKESVIRLLGNNVMYAEQKKRLGTGHALYCGLQVLPPGIEHILVVNGDDAAFYPHDVIQNLIDYHLSSKAAVTFLTIDIATPYGLGRVVRDEKGSVVKIVEEKDATEQERALSEINAACYVFSVAFLKKYSKHIRKSPVTGEYYIVSLIEMAVANQEKVEAVRGGSLVWRGVNTKEELALAEELFIQKSQAALAQK